MNFFVITIFPEIINNYISYGIISKAIKNNKINVNAINLRDYTEDKYKKVDDYIFGNGRGMLFKPEPLSKAIDSIIKNLKNYKIIYLSAQGVKFNNCIAKDLSNYDNLILISGRYEGIDSRIIEKYVDMELSIGDYVLTGGELPCLVVIDTISRYIDGSVKKESVDFESFEDGLLEYPHYTEPVVFKGMVVPEILRSGDHKKVNEYRLYQSLKKTYFNRIDLLNKFKFDDDDNLTKDNKLLKYLRKKNKILTKYLDYFNKISKEWKDVRRTSNG